MSTQASPRRYVRAGPFNQGVYAEVPTHEFERPYTNPACARLGIRPSTVGVWRCRHCGTQVSDHRKAAVERHGCDGEWWRCAICNTRISVAGVLVKWAGLVCRNCADAHQDALTCHDCGTKP
jgi:hypothetical protein